MSAIFSLPLYSSIITLPGFSCFKGTFVLESKAVKGNVTRRADDPYGQGFGFVKTGYVSSQKLSFLKRASSVDRADSSSTAIFLDEGAKGNKGLRVTWAESPTNSRPASNLSWTDKVVEMDAQAVRAQTPPLAGEWAVSKGSTTESKSFMQSTNTGFASNSNAVATTNNHVITAATNNAQLASKSNFSMTSSSQASNKSNFSSMNMSSSQTQQTSMFSSSSSSFKSSSSFQTGSVRSKTFEAFPGMGGIENLNLDNEKAGN